VKNAHCWTKFELLTSSSARGDRRSEERPMIETYRPYNHKSARILVIRKQVREILKEASESASRAIERAEQRLPEQQLNSHLKPMVSRRMRESF